MHEYGPEWLRSEPAALVAVDEALARRDDKALAALYRQERDPSAFLERLRHCAGFLVRPWAERPLLDSRPNIFESNRVWLMPIITPVGRHLPPFIPDPHWLREIQACLQDWMGPKVNLAMLQGVAGWGDLSKLSPARWRHIVDSLANAASGEGAGRRERHASRDNTRTAAVRAGGRVPMAAKAGAVVEIAR